MELITVRELFKNTAAYAGKEVEVGGWVQAPFQAVWFHRSE